MTQSCYRRTSLPPRQESNTGVDHSSRLTFCSLSTIEHLQLDPTQVIQWCDNLMAFKGTYEPLCCPKAMVAADVDIILAIHHLPKTIKYPTICQHVYVHHDGKNKKKAILASPPEPPSTTHVQNAYEKKT